MTTIHHVWHKRQRYAMTTEQVIALILCGVSRRDLYLTVATRNEKTEINPESPTYSKVREFGLRLLKA